MRNSFLIQLFYAVAEGLANGGGNAPAPLTSEKLTELEAAHAAAWAVMITMKDPKAQETKDAKLAVWKIEGEIKAEEARLNKEAQDAKLTEARNARLSLNQNQLDAYAALLAVKADKKATPEQVQTAQTAFDTAKEAVDNELLAKYASSSPAKKSSSTDTGTTSEKSANKAAILELARAGKTKKEIEDAGYKRSTVWHTINDAKIAGETFPNH